MRKLSKEKKVYIGLIILSLAIYLFSKVAYSGALLLLLLVYGIISWFGVLTAGRNVEVSMHAEGEGERYEPVQCRLELSNKKFIPILNLRISLKMVNKLTEVSHVKRMSTSLRPHGDKTVEFAFQDNCCGEIDVAVDKCTVSDPLNLWEREISVSEAVDVCRISPIISEAEVTNDDLQYFDMESFRFSDVLKGNDPSETVGIKSYESGDSIKAIHWKLSSKLDDVVIREFGYPIDNKVLVILDKRLGKNIDGEGLQDKDVTRYKLVCEKKAVDIDKTVNLFMSISYALLRREVNHTLGWFDYERQQFVNKSITSDDDMYASIPSLIGGPFKEDEVLTAVRFLESDCTKVYGSILFVTSRFDIEDELESLRDYGEVRVFRPGNEEE